ncbi:hypothetical protein [Deinococcus sp. 12RED42]|uniref:hypothetical protein n=1 Tax=Deinococcus sp. 12RED42 TaxID=2745872 RepID=UPI001E32DE1A|nr:hypothetical protein [Deinococcus sp. 12RED42]MCD0166956.1 hypothetical protein [Deinococcus sp. 12RED42]
MILSSMWADGIKDSPNLNVGIAEYLKGNDSLVNSYSSSNDYSLYSREKMDVVKYFASEAAKFACASLETMCSMKYSDLINNKSQGWNMIKLYYAAFYAAHSIMRSAGNSVTMIDKGISNIISRKLEYGGYTLATAAKGEHLTTFNSSIGTLDIKYIGGIGNGTHERFWHHFNLILEELKIKVAAAGIAADERAQLIVQISKLQEVLNGNSNGMLSWLSTMRNDVTYKIDHGVWFPYIEKTKSGNPVDVKQNSELWLDDPENINLDGANDIQSFVYACHFMISISHVNVMLLANLSENKRNPFRNKYVAMLNMAK